MRYETDPDPFWLRWYKKAIWSRKTPLLVLVCLFAYSFVTALLVEWRLEFLDYTFFTNFIFVVPLAVASISIGIRPFLRGKGRKLACLKIALFWLAVIGILAFNAFVTLGKGERRTVDATAAQGVDEQK